jgi:hypothetical protein
MNYHRTIYSCINYCACFEKGMYEGCMKDLKSFYLYRVFVVQEDGICNVKMYFMFHTIWNSKISCMSQHKIEYFPTMFQILL